MALTRSFLKSTGLTDEQINAVMEEHVAVTDSLKSERDTLKAEAEKYRADAELLPDVKKQLAELRGIQEKYEKEHAEYSEYKAQVAREAEEAKVRNAYRKLLTDERISEKRLDAIMRVTDFSSISLDRDGALKNADALREQARKDWGDFIQTDVERGATVENPPKTDTNAFNGMSLSEKMVYANRNPTAPEVRDWLNRKE